MTSGKRAAEEPHPAPYLAQSATHHARNTTSSSDSTSTRTRRQRPRKQREDRYEEEIQFNIAYFSDTRGQRRPPQPSRMVEEEYPPPPAYERATAASVSTLVSEDFVHETGPSLPVQAAVSVPSTPVIGVRQHADRSDSISLNTVPATLQAEEDRSSIELIDLDPAVRWELERQHGVPLEERVRRHKLRAIDASSPTTMPHRTRLFSQPTSRRPTGMQFHTSQLSLRIPEGHDRYDDDRAQDNSDLSSSPSPKHPRLPHIPVSPPKLFHIRSQSPQASSSVISLLRNPSPFFKSTPSLLSLPPSHHGNHSRSRKLFHRKSKEPSSSEPLDDWEVLERTGSAQSTTNGSTTPPLNPPKHTPHRLPTPENDQYHQHLPNDHVNNTSTIQIPQTGSNVQRGSPLFVSRHVRRHTNSGRSGRMSAPASPDSVSSVSTFSSSTTTLSERTAVDDDAQQVSPSREQQPEVRSTTYHGVSASRTYGRTPRISSPAPPPPALYEHDPELPVLSGGLGPLPARSATERIVRPSEAREGQRGRSLSREMCMRSAPAYSMLFPSGPPFPLPGIQTPPQESQTLPPPLPCKCPTATCSSASGCASGSTSSQFSSGTCPPLLTCPPGFTIPQTAKRSPSQTRPSPSAQSCPQTPRKHYPGRPLPATPPVSPSLTWILDGQTHVQPHPRALSAALAHAQSSPWTGTPTLPEKAGLPYIAHTPTIPEPAPQYTQLPEKAPRTPPMPGSAPDTPTIPVTTPCTPPMPGAFSRTPPIPESTSHTPPISESALYSPPMPLSLLSTPPVPEGLLIDLSDDENSPDSESPADVPTSPDLLELLQPPPAPAPKCMDLLDFGDEEPLQSVNSVSLEDIPNNDPPSSQAPHTRVLTPVNLLEDDFGYGGGDEHESTDNNVDEDDSASDSGTVSPPGPLTPSTMSGFVSASGSVVSLVPISVSPGHAPAMRIGREFPEDAMSARDAKPRYADAPRLGTPRQRPSAPTAC